MRNRSLRALAFTALLGASAIATGSTFVTDVHAADDPSSWTVMIYMEANNSLANFALETFSEILKVGKKKGLTIIVQVDTGKHKVVDGISGMPKGSGVKRVVVHKDSVTEEEKDVGDDMVSPEGLANFIEWGVKQHPADRYAVMLWDHGAGWHGCCEAETPSLRAMSLKDISKGFKKGLEQSGEKEIDLVGFDECLMAEVEVAHALAPYVHVMVASEELEPGEGMDYEKWLGAIASDPTMKPTEVGKAIADGYVNHVEGQSGNPTYTLSVLNLHKLEALETATGKMGKQLSKLDDWSAVGAARAKSDEFGGQDKDAFNVIDLGQFAKNAKKLDGVDAAADVLTAMDELVTYSVAGPMHKGVKGLSIYLPQQNVDSEYESVGFNDKWTSFVNKYADGAGKDTTPPDTDDVTFTNDDDSSGGGGGGGGSGERTMLTLDGLDKSKDVKQISVVLAEDVKGEHVFLGEIPVRDAAGIAEGADTSKINVDWNGKWPMVTDGTNTKMVPLFAIKQYEDNGHKMAIVEMPADYAEDGTTFDRPIRVQFAVDLATNGGKMISAFETKKGAAGAVKIDTGAVRASIVDVNDKGPYTKKVGTEIFKGKLEIVASALPDKEYMVGVHMTDYAGNSATKLVNVKQMLAVVEAEKKKATAGCGLKKKLGCAIDPGEDSDALGFAMGGGFLALALVRRRSRRALPEKSLKN